MLGPEDAGALWRALGKLLPSLPPEGHRRTPGALATALRAAAALLDSAAEAFEDAQEWDAKRARMDASPDPRNRVGGEERAESTSQPAGVTGKRAQRRPRPFDVGRYMARRVAMEVAYVGWHYRGLARQEGADDTIEHHLFAALRKTRLVPDDVLPEALGYSRCGRTDRGVSALSQVVTFQLRSRALRADHVELPAAEEELDYVGMLNAVLPEDIQVLGWCPVPETFSARFDCRGREYRYHMCSPGTQPLDVDRMRAACSALVGEHDFRNFCKADPNVPNHVRRILSCDVERVAGLPGVDVVRLTVRGTAFLWHQVRCLVAVLRLVGEGKEDPSVVAALLDTSVVPSRPQYMWAPERPLLLFGSAYDALPWYRPAKPLSLVLEKLRERRAALTAEASGTQSCHVRVAATKRGNCCQRNCGDKCAGPHLPAPALSLVAAQAPSGKTAHQASVYTAVLRRACCCSRWSGVSRSAHLTSSPGLAARLERNTCRFSRGGGSL